MEEVVPENLGEKDLHAVFRELLDVGAGRAQGLHVADGDAVDAFLDQHLGPAEIPVDLWHVEHLRTLEVALQLCSVAGLAHEVQFVDDRLLVLGDDFERFEALAVLPVS
jgi:hypothetical protein